MKEVGHTERERERQTDRHRERERESPDKLEGVKGRIGLMRCFGGIWKIGRVRKGKGVSHP